jgi:pyruvate dehydrogenase E2 component (dihydrolipoamide acetyltransferase)
MTDPRIIPIVMPKWGLSMKEGTLTSWLVQPGKTIAQGEPILEVETDKIAGEFQSTDAGLLRRAVGVAGTTYPVKALLGVLAPSDVPDAAIDEYVAAYVTPVAAEDGEEDGPKHEWAELGFGKMRYARRGESGDAVILIHGFGGDLDNWLFNIDALAEKNTVYAMDLPGHGLSSKTLADPSFGALTSAIEEFMDSVGLSSAHFIGHSLGGAIAMQIAAQTPAKVKTMSLICSAGMGPEFGTYVKDYVAAESRRDLKPVLEMLFADKSQVSRQLVDDVLKFKRLDGVDSVLRALADSLFAGDVQQNLPVKGVAGRASDALIIWGKQDEVIPSAHANNLSGATVHVFDDAGHMVFMEKANDVNALLKAHVSR